MLKALAWKEWREQRPVIYTGAILVALMPLFLAAGLPLSGPNMEMIDLVGMIPVALGIFVWPILAAAAGASTISTEKGAGTLGFLLSRPVSRRRLWLVKVSVALLSTGMVAIISLAVAQVCNAWLLRGQLDTSLGVLLRRASFGPFDLLALVSLSFLLFACATLFSTLIPRPLPAAAAGAALALLVLAGVFLLWATFSLTPQLEPQWLAAEVVVAAAMVLLVSFAIFTRAELLRGGSGWRFLAVVGGLALGLLGLVAIPAAHAAARLSPDGVVIRGAGIAVSNSAVAMTVDVAAGRGQEIWLVGADGSGTSSITGRHTLSPTFFRGGRELAYFSKRGFAGAVLEDYDLRAVRPDGNQDRLIASGLRGTGELFFSSYGSRALLAVDDTLHMIGLNGRELESHDISGQDLVGAKLAGWTDTLGDEVLFVRREPAGQSGLEEMTLLAYGLESGTTRRLLSAMIDPVSYVQPRQPDYGWRYFPLPVAAGETAGAGMRVELFDLESGAISVLDETSCFSGEFARNSSVLTYVLCGESPDGGSVATVLVRTLDRGNLDEEMVVYEIDLGGGSVTLIATRVTNYDEGIIWALLEQEISPGGETIAVVIGPEGHRLGMLPGWKPVGLTGTARVLLVDDREHIRTIASGDIRTGMLRVIYP